MFAINYVLVVVNFLLCNLTGVLIFQVSSVFSRKLVEEFSWKEIDFEFNTPYDRKIAIETELFIKGASIPTSLEVWSDRMFIATPRIKPGVPSTLNYISLSDVNTKSPKLTPYPSWEMNNNANKSSKKVKMTSVYNIRADPCNRLWALDTGISEEAATRKIETPPTIFVFNLNENTLVRKHTLQETEYDEDSNFRFLIVDVTSGTCESAFAYIADTKNGLLVYSWYTNKSFRVTNNYFSFEPIWGNFKTSLGQNIQLNDGLFGMSLTLPNLNGFRQLLFHPMVGINEFRVSTEVLQNRTLATSKFTDFYLLGSRGVNSQSTASFMDLETGVLMYTTLIMNGVSCWNQFKGESLTPENQGIIDVFPYEYSFPYDLKIDKNGTLWVLTNRLLDFLHEKQDGSTSFRIYSGFVRSIIKGTPCEEI